MEELIKELKTHFAAGLDGLRRITALPDEYVAYTYRNSGVFGLAIEFDDEKVINEAANEVVYSTQTLLKESGEKKFLLLTCLDEEYRNQFAELSYSFITPGDNGANRHTILADPISWWNKWTELLGDRKSKKGSYDVLAELIALDYLYQQDKSTRWSASEAGTHDIESDSQSFEVKSTTKKSESHITISSRFQLESTNRLELFFFRLECSLSGFSINDAVVSLEKHGYDRNLIESQLEEKGFVRGRSTRNIKYTILEVRRFIVDDNFPKIVEKSFKNDVFPQNIIKILDTIDLEGINYTSMNFIMNSDGTISSEMGNNCYLTSINNDESEENHTDIYSEMHEGCIPLYSMRAACGVLTRNDASDGEEPEIEGWIDVSGQGFTPDKDKFFVVYAKGDSMKPKIKDGDLCVFEWYNKRGGTREGDIVLIYAEDKIDAGSNYTIKKYHSERAKTDDGWEHEKIILKPLNPDYEPIELSEDMHPYTIGVLKCVL